eukprot:362367-Rhodomonas_salina.4
MCGLKEPLRKQHGQPLQASLCRFESIGLLHAACGQRIATGGKSQLATTQAKQIESKVGKGGW